MSLDGVFESLQGFDGKGRCFGIVVVCFYQEIVD